MQERFLEGRTALVTGCVQGIGFAIGKAPARLALVSRFADLQLATRRMLPFELYSRPELLMLVFLMQICVRLLPLLP
jgi:hypothetical protein